MKPNGEALVRIARAACQIHIPEAGLIGLWAILERPSQTPLKTNPPVPHKLAKWANGLQTEGLAMLWSNFGKTFPSLIPRLPGEDAGPVTVCNIGGKGYVQLWKSVFERRAAS